MIIKNQISLQENLLKELQNSLEQQYQRFPQSEILKIDLHCFQHFFCKYILII